MSNYKIEVQVKIVECPDSKIGNPRKTKSGSFEMNISESQAVSIDDCEQALLKTNYAAIRDALAQHLSEVSKKKSVSKA